VLAFAWATLAIYYSNLPWPWQRLVLAAANALFTFWALFLSRQQPMSVAAPPRERRFNIAYSANKISRCEGAFAPIFIDDAFRTRRKVHQLHGRG
jgi:hypothetical protein